MLQVLYLLKFNQYYNRMAKGKRFTAFEEYEDFVIAGPFTNTNFNPNDGITTAHTLNVSQSISDEADYLLVTDDEGNLVSRWFITQAKRELNGQYTLGLKRDLLVEYYDAISRSTAYIERAHLFSAENPLIYNSEGMQFNQIKKREFLLPDTTLSPYVVAYIAKNYTGGTVTARDSTIETEFSYSKTELESELELYGEIISSSLSFVAELENYGNVNEEWKIYSSGYCEKVSTSEITIVRNVVLKNKTAPEDCASVFRQDYSNNRSFFESRIYSYAEIENSASKIETLLEMSGKLVKNLDDDSYFTFEIVRQQPAVKTITLPVNSELYVKTEEILESNPFVWKVNVSGSQNDYKLGAQMERFVVRNIETVSGSEVSIELSTDQERIPLSDAPYDMLCIPCKALLSGKPTEGTFIRSRTDVAINIGQAIATALGGSSQSFCYDVQLLPYCPCLEYYSGNSFSLSGLTEGTHYNLIKEGDNIVGAGFWCRSQSFNGTTKGFMEDPYSNSYVIRNPSDPEEFKVRDQCDFYRVVSPNYSGAFEFSSTKNGGIFGFEFNCTYKPIQPYIQVNPIFGGLYGGDYNDSRGLICGGDFSLPVVNDAWTNYQIQNKSYRESFDRSVENMETTYSIQMEQAKTSAVIQGISGTISAATSGFIMGGGAYGAVAAGAVGAVANIAGAAKDFQYAQRLQDEALSFAADKFNYSLQNIQALPNTLSRTSAFDINNKIFPFLEFYSCTDAEKDALRKKIKYNGMSVRTIDTIGSYVDGTADRFVQCQLIRFDEECGADYHLVAEIASELQKGVYL